MIEFFHKSYAQTPDGLVISADGINAVRRWDGVAASFDTAGVIAPVTALTIRSSGKGPIYGEYRAYTRFKDGRGNLSDLSPISEPFRPYTTGEIVTATNTVPIAIGSVAHGLDTGDKVTITNVQGNTAANAYGWTITVHDENNFSLNGSVGNGAHTVNTGVWVGGLTTPPGRGHVTTATNTTPIAIGSFAHGLTNGASVTIRGVQGNTAANGTWVITFIDANNYSLNGSVGNGAHVANTGYWTGTLVSPSSGTVILATNTSPINIGSVAHGLNTGNTVTITGVTGNTAANVTANAITVVDANNYTLDGTTGSGGYSSGGTWVGGSGPPFFSNALTGATAAEPIVITSTDHGLTTGDVVTITGVQGNTEANGFWTVFRIDANTFSLDDSQGTAAYTTGGTWTAGARAILYSSVPVSTETKVTNRQVLRNTDGQADVFYVDIDTTDLVDTTLESTRDDDDLAAQEAVPLLDDDGAALANIHGVPPNHKATLAHHAGRLYYAAEVVVRQGHAQVTNGSVTVTGIATNWKSTFATRAFYVVGSITRYTIASVNEVAQTLTLTTAYTGTTDLFAVYAIRPIPAEHRAIYYSESGLPESVPATNRIMLPENDDEITGQMQAGSYLFFLERHHIWRFSVQNDPAIDGFPWPVANRGCINNRCYAIVGEKVYLLDSDGIYGFAGSGDVDAVGTTIQDIFRPSDFEFQLNLQAAVWFHCSHYHNQETIRWFVAFSGQDRPRHAITYNYRQNRWSIEEFERPITASVTGDLGAERRRIVYLGSDAKTTLAMWTGTLDGPDPDKGTVLGTVTSATLTSITDTLAIFPSAGVVGNPIAIVDGRGKDQVRRVSAVSGTTITVSQPWLTLPDTTSVYQLGGINWQYQTGFFRYVENELNEPTRLELVFQPQEEDATLDMRVFEDYSKIIATAWNGDRPIDDGNGVRTINGEDDLVVDLTKSNGLIQQRMDRHRDIYADGSHYISVELAGTTSEDQTKIYELTIDGATP